MFRFLFITLFSFSFLFSQGELTIVKQGDIFTDFEVGVYEDKSTKLSFEEIKKTEKFTPQSNRISTGFSKSSFWYKFEIKNSTNTDLDYIVKFTENQPHELDVYIETNNGKYDKHSEGIGYFQKNSKNQIVHPEFPITLKNGESKTVYFRMLGIYPNFTSVLILDEKSLNNYNIKFIMFYFLYFGVLMAMILYNSFLYFSTKDISYGYYVSYVLLFLLWQFQENGFPPFDQFDSTSSFYLGSIVPIVLMSFLIFFSRATLFTKKLFPYSDKLLLFIAYLCFLLAFSSVFYLVETLVIFNIIVTFICSFLLYLAFKSYKTGNKTALFYIIAQISFLTTATLFSLMTDGILEYNLVTRHSVVVGSFFEVVIFSLALGYRIKVLQKEKSEMILETIKKDNILMQQSKLSSMGEMVDAIAHQWKQPLNIIHAIPTVLKMKLDLGKTIPPKEIEECASKVQTQVDHLVETLDEFRGFFRPNIKKELCHIAKSLESVKLLLKNNIQSSGVALHVECPSDIRAYIIPAEFKHIFINLINNSIEAFEQNSVVKRVITLHVADKKGEITIILQDNAGGIPKEISNRLFDINITTKVSGSGMGLYMTKMIVEKLGGTIEVKNVNDGACFTLSLSSIQHPRH